MKINVTPVLKSIDGTDLQGEDKKPFTLRKASVEALAATYDDERPTGEEKLRRYQLAVKIHQNDELDLESEEIALVKLLIAKAFGPAVVGPSWLLLEGKA